MKVAFQGEFGAFSESMALEMYSDAITIPCKSFEEVFDMVNRGKADTGVIPLENSITGRISGSTNLLMERDLFLCKEGKLRIEHCLIAQRSSGKDSIRRIYSHPEAISQCRRYLDSCGCEVISWWDGAAAAKKVLEDAECAIVGNIRIASIYGLKVLEKGIQDSRENFTRFGAIGTFLPRPTGNDKTTIAFKVLHKGGKLHDALEPLSRANINLTRIESMPIKDKPWEYAFIADFEGHCKDKDVEGALEEMEGVCSEFKVIGSYQRTER
ncbi:MAG TPA: prephenate dehydratase [Candidatus Methanofastidiosa archaeon]|nr:prephenate dehydratase [Candidatus Methanofastidiosa archaeon]